MTYRVIAVSPEGHRIAMGLGCTHAHHALEDRDELRAAYLRQKSSGWTVVAEDPSGKTLHWSDVEASVTAGDA